MRNETNSRSQETSSRRARVTSDYSNCLGQRRDKQGPLSRGSRTVKTHRTCPAFRASWLFSRLYVSGQILRRRRRCVRRASVFGRD